MRTSLWVGLLVFGLMRHSGWSQANGWVDVAPESSRFSAGFYPKGGAMPVMEAPVLHVPYTAILRTTTTTKDETGKLFYEVEKDVHMRDGLGRVRTESSLQREDEEVMPVEVRRVKVDDVVSHCTMEWDEPWLAAGKPIAATTCRARQARFVDRVDLGAAALAREDGEAKGYPGQTGTVEHLPEQLVFGVRAKGVRTTLVAQGSSKVTRTTEWWYSAELRETIVLRVTDADGQGTELALTEIHQGEPEEARFYPPKRYVLFPLGIKVAAVAKRVSKPQAP